MSVRTWWGFSGIVFLRFFFFFNPPSLPSRWPESLPDVSQLLQLSPHRLPPSMSSRSLWELLQRLAGAQAPTEYMDERWLRRGFVLSRPLHLWSVSQGKEFLPGLVELHAYLMIAEREQGMHLVCLSKIFPRINESIVKDVGWKNYVKKKSLVSDACVCMIPACALDMNQLGRGHFCIQARKGLMTYRENLPKVLRHFNRKPRWMPM